jgi:hypothetical protein
MEGAARSPEGAPQKRQLLSGVHVHRVAVVVAAASVTMTARSTP